MAYKILNENKVSKESENVETAQNKDVNSTDLLDSIIGVKELPFIEKELHEISKKYGVECQLVVGAKNLSWASSYYGKGKIINDLGVPSLRYIFLAPQNVPRFPNRK